MPDFGQWECNRPIEFAFDRPIDFASVSARSIRIQTSIGVPAAGSFTARSIDADGDGLPESTDESVVVFHPRCPEAEDLSDAGFTPGARYLVKLAGEDSGAEPDELVRSKDGHALARSVVLAFETIADPARTLFDEKPGPPEPLVRAVGASAGTGSYLELGEDPAHRVFFEGDSSSGRTPSGFLAPLNLLGDRATHVAAVVVFDQPIRGTPANLARLRLEYNSTSGPSGWRALETRAEVLSNCRPENPAVRLVPLGSFPPGGSVRARIEAGFEDLVGQVTREPFDRFALAEVTTVAFTSLDPVGAVADELHEEFDFGPGSPLSFADPAAPPDAAPAEWGQGELSAHHAIVDNPAELREFDWVVRTGERVLFDTAESSILGGPDGERTLVQSTNEGFLAVRNLEIQPGGAIRVMGPHPLVIHASGTVTINGPIDARGFDALDLFQAGVPGVGGVGAAGGGNGGMGRLGMDLRGSDGAGAFGARPGGGGGESGFASGQSSPRRRGGGGGGGCFAGNRGVLVAENGGDGVGAGAESGVAPARGGAAGPGIITDGDPSNDFFGIQPIVDASGIVVAKRRGELDRIHAGSGGGNGGDSIASDSFPLPPAPAIVDEGGGGGGGGGGVVIRATGRIVFGPDGRILVNGGRGGRTIVGFNPAKGAAGGSGSGGHLILESAEAIDFTAGSPTSSSRLWVQADGGPRMEHFGQAEASGGAGGPGVVQLHAPPPSAPWTIRPRT